MNVISFAFVPASDYNEDMLRLFCAFALLAFISTSSYAAARAVVCPMGAQGMEKIWGKAATDNAKPPCHNTDSPKSKASHAQNVCFCALSCAGGMAFVVPVYLHPDLIVHSFSSQTAQKTFLSHFVRPDHLPPRLG